MTFNLQVLTSNGIIWNSDAQEVILSTNSGKIGILPNHEPLLTGLEIGIMKARIDSTWIAMALLGGFAQIENNKVIILVLGAEKASEINLEEAQLSLNTAKNQLSQAVTRKQQIEANLAVKRAKARLDAVKAVQ
jgi:F-type H+-transporting ATPase subunit epsilon